MMEQENFDDKRTKTISAVTSMEQFYNSIKFVWPAFMTTPQEITLNNRSILFTVNSEEHIVGINLLDMKNASRTLINFEFNQSRDQFVAKISDSACLVGEMVFGEASVETKNSILKLGGFIENDTKVGLNLGFRRVGDLYQVNTTYLPINEMLLPKVAESTDFIARKIISKYFSM